MCVYIYIHIHIHIYIYIYVLICVYTTSPALAPLPPHYTYAYAYMVFSFEATAEHLLDVAPANAVTVVILFIMFRYPVKIVRGIRQFIWHGKSLGTSLFVRDRLDGGTGAHVLSACYYSDSMCTVLLPRPSFPHRGSCSPSRPNQCCYYSDSICNVPVVSQEGASPTGPPSALILVRWANRPTG